MLPKFQQDAAKNLIAAYAEEVAIDNRLMQQNAPVFGIVFWKSFCQLI